MNYERIATLLASGLPPAQVATIVGLSAGRISQIMKEESFIPILASKQAEVQAADIEEISLSAKYTAAEHGIIDQMMAMIPHAELRDLTGALRVVAERQEKAKVRLNPIQGSAPVIHTTVQLALPTYVMPAIQYNQEKEVISVGNRDLAPMSSNAVTSLFKGMSEVKHDERTIHAIAEESLREALPQSSNSAGLADSARRFLDSLDPAPYAVRV